MEPENQPRRYKPRPTESKGTKTIMILLLLINTSALGCLLFLNFRSYDQAEKQEVRLSNIEEKVNFKDQTAFSETTSLPETTKTQPSASNDLETTTSQLQEPVTSSERTVTRNSPQDNSTSNSSEDVSPTESNANYIVKAGDTLSDIATQNNMTVAELMAKNDLTDQTVLVGQELIVK